MNKKFFAALTSAAMLLGSPVGVLAAEEMVEVENGSVPGVDVDQSNIKIDEVNFPDKNFRKAVLNGLAGLTGDNAIAGFQNQDGVTVSTESLSKILTLGDFGQAGSDDISATNAYSPIDYDATTDSEAKSIKDLTGIEYLTGLQVLNLQYSPQLKVADLTNNGELVTVIIAPTAPTNATAPITVNSGTGAITITTPAGPSSYGSNDLYSITLPEETANLVTLVIEGASQLTTLDLSAYDSLAYVDLQNNALAELNVEGCSSIVNLNVSGNDLVGLDVSTLKALDTLTANNNNIYELELPSGKKLETINIANNKLATLDVENVKSLTTLNAADNRLESIDLSNNTALENLNLSYNHLATLDLTKNSKIDGTTGAWASATATGIALTPQYLYANIPDTGIDLANYDENFQADSNSLGWVANTAAVTTNVVGGTITKAGVFEFGAEGPYSYIYLTGTTKGSDNFLTVNIVKADLMNRLYNPNSGEHFYTADLNEKDTLVKLGWQAEGIGWISPEENSKGVTGAAQAVFRLYNPNAGDHHYTLDSKEKDTLVRAGWNYEGVGWYSAQWQGSWGSTDPASDLETVSDPAKGTIGYSIPVYREYNPNAKEAGAHNYTTSENENDTLVGLGWLDEGIGWRALK